MEGERERRWREEMEMERRWKRWREVGEEMEGGGREEERGEGH
jgi:hypothetical protein